MRPRRARSDRSLPNDGPRLSRRALLGVLLGAPAVLVVALWSRLRRPVDQIVQLLEPTIDPASPAGDLAAGELEALVAFAEVLGGDEELRGESRESVASYLTRQARTTPGYLRLYRLTAGLLDGVADARFAALPLAERKRVVATRILPAGDPPPRAYRLLFQRGQLALEKLVVPDLVRGYYSGAAGWAAVGYAFYPGRCGGGLARYTRPE